MEQFVDEVARRRTFAIIAHPDAGKTTLTEKLLLYGGAIHQAGSVRARKTDRHALSDWMDIEKQRGISVTSSVMQFDYDGYRINILDTPGHQDFSEDTYRTLVAVDSAVMLIDCAKGVEAQTIKLFKVCRLRHIPIFTFVNKLDHAGRDPFDLMDELENILGIRACAVDWPIGTNGDFKGVYHRDTRLVELYEGGNHGMDKVQVTEIPIDDPTLPDVIGRSYYNQLMEEIELLEAGDEFDLDRITRGELTPMFFGSAINNFGVEPFLKRFLKYTYKPGAHTADEGIIEPDNPDFTGFIFKIQANMNPAHRDRLAFMRICSGVFEKNMEVWHSSQDKFIKLTQPQQFMAQEHETVERAYPGDIVGLFDPGIFRLGDTLSVGKHIHYAGIPLFAPEHFAVVSAMDSMKRKQFVKGITQLSQEGAIQTFKRPDVGREEIIVGVVGMLQFEVLEHRLKHEYGVDLRMEHLSFTDVRWVLECPMGMEKLRIATSTRRAIDRAGRDVLLFENPWSVQWALEHNEGLKLAETADRTSADTDEMY